MRRTVVVALAGALLAAAPTLAATPTADAAASVIQFGKIQYNSPGADNGRNPSLNAEWVDVKNTGRTTVNLRGWKIRDKAKHVFTFTIDTKVRAGGSVRVHTGKGTPSAGHRYWGKTSYIWNNTGDTATLIRPGGTAADTCKWSDPDTKHSVKVC